MSLMEGKDYEYGLCNWRDQLGRSIRTDGCILLFCVSGRALVSVEFKPRAVRRGDIVMIFPDTLFVVNDVSESFAAKRIEISSGLFDEATFTLSSPFFDYLYEHAIFRTSPEQWEQLGVWEDQLRWIMRCRSQKSAYVMLRNHLQNFFMAVESVVVSEGAQTEILPTSPARRLFNRFCRLVVEHCYAHHDVKFYADELCITPYYLSKITNKAIKISPKELIDRQIILEMKRLLINTDISVKELATRFHFDSVSYMARFFRRYTGATPMGFREQ